MKKVVLSLAVAALALGANAQKKESKGSEGFRFNAGIKAALPMGDLADATSFGIGAEAGGEYHFSEQFSGVASVSYTYFVGKEDKTFGVKINYGVLPILAGVRFYPTESFFIGAKAGAGIFSASVSGASVSTTGLGYEPHIGYNGEKFQISAGYLGISKEGSSISAVSLTGVFKF